ncbi:hypothetical protein HY631_02305 [Candidatus Uhrbacteria bacterium]|nr:hypothetical protein [Candidatus Uhrbacteria bacterium]
MTSYEQKLREVQADRETRLGVVREKLGTIDLASLRHDLVKTGDLEMFIEPALALFQNPRFLERLRDNLHQDAYSFGEIVKDLVADEISRTTPKGWVEPMYVSGTHPSRKLCEALRDKIVVAFGKDT